MRFRLCWKEKSKRSPGFFGKLFTGNNSNATSSSTRVQPTPSGGDNNNTTTTGGIGSMVKPRKAPIKVVPKVFFANERTFLAWGRTGLGFVGAGCALLSTFHNNDQIDETNVNKYGSSHNPKDENVKTVNKQEQETHTNQPTDRPTNRLTNRHFPRSYEVLQLQKKSFIK